MHNLVPVPYIQGVALGFLGFTCSPRDSRLVASDPVNVDVFQDVKVLRTSPSGEASLTFQVC